MHYISGKGATIKIYIKYSLNSKSTETSKSLSGRDEYMEKTQHHWSSGKFKSKQATIYQVTLVKIINIKRTKHSGSTDGKEKLQSFIFCGKVNWLDLYEKQYGDFVKSLK